MLTHKFFSDDVIIQFSFFFFQAEDGIRDWSVTGVQTCALPIYGCAYRLAGSTTRATRRDHPGRGQRHLSQRLAHLDRGLGLDRPTIATAQGHRDRKSVV